MDHTGGCGEVFSVSGTGELGLSNEMNNPSVFCVGICAAGYVGAACVLMERDKRAGGRRTPLDLARGVKKPRCLGPPRQAAWNFYILFIFYECKVI